MFEFLLLESTDLMLAAIQFLNAYSHFLCLFVMEEQPTGQAQSLDSLG